MPGLGTGNGAIWTGRTSRRNPADLAGACSGGEFVESRAGEAYDAQARSLNRKFRIKYRSAERSIPKFPMKLLPPVDLSHCSARMNPTR